VIHYFNGHDNASGNEDEEEYDEANPALFACRSCRGDSLLRITKTTKGDGSEAVQAVKEPSSPSFDIFFNFRSLSLDDIDSLILLFDQDTHLIKIVSAKQSRNGHKDGRH
jgi:hypothetical protein